MDKIHYNQITEDQKDIIGDGCGVGYGIFNKLVPDIFWKASCDQHDFYYKRGGDLIDKMEADVMFYAHMLKSINDRYEGMFKKFPLFGMATVYFLGTVTLGLLFWSWRFHYRTLKEIIDYSYKIKKKYVR